MMQSFLCYIQCIAFLPHTNVATVSGATFSSKGIINAVSNALATAGNYKITPFFLIDSRNLQAL
jgi:hypothetical protein